MVVPTVITAHPDPALARAQQRAVRDGTLLRIGHGAFVTRDEWMRASEWEQHIARASAVQAKSDRFVLSHASAVVAHRLPWIRPTPARVTVLDPARGTGQRTRYTDKIAAAERSVESVVIDGMRVTGLVDTAVDVALRYDRARALSVADAVLRRGVTAEELSAALRERPGARAMRRAEQVVRLASARSDSAGESVTSLVFDDIGLPQPIRQHEFHDARGFIGRVDFWFPDQGVIVEFDGLAKYRDPSMRSGRTPEQVVIDEKVREDRLRALPTTRGLARLLWRDVEPGGCAPELLAAAGLPVRRGVSRTPAW